MRRVSESTKLIKLTPLDATDTFLGCKKRWLGFAQIIVHFNLSLLNLDRLDLKLLLGFDGKLSLSLSLLLLLDHLLKLLIGSLVLSVKILLKYSQLLL